MRMGAPTSPWLITVSVVALAVVALVATVMLRRLATARRRIGQLEAQLARDTAAERELAAADERARIAREMHDVVAHTLSVVVAQADGGRFVAAANPGAAAHSLETIAEVSRSALAEMRTLLGVLRSPAGDAPLGPQPSLGDIPALVTAARDDGLEVSLVTTGTPRTLPIGAGLAAFRIVQESLTNVRKHAGPQTRAFVQLAWEEDALEVAVSDDGRGAAAHDDGAGQGIAGMTERAGVFGGTLTAGPRAGGGYVVRMRLPLTRPQSSQEGDVA